MRSLFTYWSKTDNERLHRRVAAVATLCVMQNVRGWRPGNNVTNVLVETKILHYTSRAKADIH